MSCGRDASRAEYGVDSTGESKGDLNIGVKFGIDERC